MNFKNKILTALTVATMGVFSACRENPVKQAEAPKAPQTTQNIDNEETLMRLDDTVVYTYRAIIDSTVTATKGSPAEKVAALKGSLENIDKRMTAMFQGCTFKSEIGVVTDSTVSVGYSGKMHHPRLVGYGGWVSLK